MTARIQNGICTNTRFGSTSHLGHTTRSTPSTPRVKYQPLGIRYIVTGSRVMSRPPGRMPAIQGWEYQNTRQRSLAPHDTRRSPVNIAPPHRNVRRTLGCGFMARSYRHAPPRVASTTRVGGVGSTEAVSRHQSATVPVVTSDHGPLSPRVLTRRSMLTTALPRSGARKSRRSVERKSSAWGTRSRLGSRAVASKSPRLRRTLVDSRVQTTANTVGLRGRN